MQFSSSEKTPIKYKSKHPKFYIGTTTLILFSFCSVFYSRIICSLTGLPSILNFAHFGVVTVTFMVALLTAKTKERSQILLSRQILLGIAALFGVMVISAFINQAGILNVIFNFLILSEPFIFLLAIVCIPLSPISIKKIKNWLLASALINFLLAEIQKPLLTSGLLDGQGMDEVDGVQGVFFVSGAGGYVSAGISIIVALYIFFCFKKVPLWLKILSIVGAMHQLSIADTKQVLLFCFLAFLFLVLTKVNNLKKFLIYVTLIVLGISFFIWAAYNLEAFAVYGEWLSRDDINQDLENGGWAVKTTGIRMVLAHYRSPLNWFFGLGPGHTLGRLGGWSIMEYWHIFSRLGASQPPFYHEMWHFINGNWIALSTTLYVPLFSWAGIWGDLGWIGIAIYLYLGFVVWHWLCFDDFNKFLVLNVFSCGFVLTQMEEPGFMLFIAILIGLRWHEKRQRYQI